MVMFNILELLIGLSQSNQFASKCVGHIVLIALRYNFDTPLTIKMPYLVAAFHIL